jgi:DNA-binding transcriptional ArsR family regulator
VSTPTAHDLNPVWRALSDPTRRRILDALRIAPMNTTALCALAPDMTRHAVISHIQVLEAAGLVRVEPRGRERINHLNVTPLREITARWLTPFEELWAGRVFRLARTAEAISLPEEPMDPVRVVSITRTSSCSAPPPVVWQALTARTGQWWVPPFAGDDSQGLSLDLSPGGVLWDQRPAGGYVLGTVRGYIEPAELILDGEFGIPGALHGRLIVSLHPDETGTVIKFTHTAIGPIPADGTTAHERGWATLLERLCITAADPHAIR